MKKDENRLEKNSIANEPENIDKLGIKNYNKEDYCKISL